MDWLDKLRDLLHKPFPEDESRFGAPKTIAAISIFVTFFLFVFQPFGIHTLEKDTFWICLGFGGTTFLAAVTYEFLVGTLFGLKSRGERWTFGKWLLNNLGIMFAISLANFLYARWLLFGYVDWSLFPQMLYATLMIGIIPIAVLGGWSLLRREQKYRGIAAEMNRRPPRPKPDPTPTEQRMVFGIPVDRIRYVEALQNYVRVGYLDAAGQFATHTERATLKETRLATGSGPVVPCHRSFLVNRAAIETAAGNAQGLVLTLADCPQTVPVSRRYVTDFREE